MIDIASPRKSGLPVSVFKFAVIGSRCRNAVLVNLRCKLFRALDEAITGLERPVFVRIPGNATRSGVQPKGIKIPAILIRLAAVEVGKIDFPLAKNITCGEDAEGDMR